MKLSSCKKVIIMHRFLLKNFDKATVKSINTPPYNLRNSHALKYKKKVNQFIKTRIGSI
jgi:hypothetical protein